MKICALILFILSAFSVSHAQILVGPEAGFLATTLTTEYAGFKLSPVFGGAFRTNQEKTVGLKTGLCYVSKGFKFNDFSDNERVNMHYLQIPVSLNLLFGKSQVRGMADFGTYLGFLLGVSDFDLEDGDKRIDMGLTLGGGLAVTELGPGTLMINIRLLEIGFIPVFDESGATPLNLNTGVIVSYLFVLGD